MSVSIRKSLVTAAAALLLPALPLPALMLVYGTAWPAAIAAAAGPIDGKTIEGKTIEHVLNRLGYGARPGDVEKVRQMGVTNYIERQLHPERIADTALEARLEPLKTLELSQSALAREYFIPAQQEKRRRKKAETQNDQEQLGLNGGGRPAHGGLAGADDGAPGDRRAERAEAVARHLQ